MVEAAITAAIASGNVPSDITAAYLSESCDQRAIIGIVFVFVLTLLFVFTRLGVRLFVLHRFGLDDILITFTLILYATFFALSIKLINLGSSRHIEYIQYVLSNSTTDETEVLDFAAHLVYTMALYTCRVSGLAFYLRLCDRHAKLLLSIKIAFGFITAALMPQMFLIIFHCQPVTALWPYGWQPRVDDFTCLAWGEIYLVNSVVSLVSDLVLFVIPAILIYIFQGDLYIKIKLSLVLLPGVLVIAISIVRLYLVNEGWVLVDVSWVYGNMLAVENAEIGATMVALSIPALKPIFSSVFSQISGLSNSMTARGNTTQKGRLGTTAQRSHLDGTNHLHPYIKTPSDVVVTAGTMNQSEDDLLTDMQNAQQEQSSWSRIKVTRTVAQSRDEIPLKDITPS